MKTQVVFAAAFLVTALLGGCASDPNIEGVQRVCAATTRTVVDQVACTKRRLEAEDWRRSPGANDIATYIAYADSVAERVRTGKLSETDAREDLRQMLTRLRSDLQSTDASRLLPAPS